MYVVSYSLPPLVMSVMMALMVFRQATTANMSLPQGGTQLSSSNATNQISASPKCYGPGITVRV